MKVIKRDGRVQDFDINKIILTLEKVSDEIAEPFTESDIQNMSEDIIDALKAKGSDSIGVNEIQETVVDELGKFGFSKAANQYRQYRNTFNK